MNDRSILFFSIVMILVFSYRIILSALLLSKKRNLLDEKYYICMFYCSLVSILVLFTDWFIVGIILICLIPVILTLYVALIKNRKYWIINGWDITESAFINLLIANDERYSKVSYRIERVKISKKRSEKKTKLEFSNLRYEEKEKILNDFKTLIKEKVVKSNKNEIYSIIINGLFVFVLLFFIMITLFT